MDSNYGRMFSRFDTIHERDIHPASQHRAAKMDNMPMKKISVTSKHYALRSVTTAADPDLTAQADQFVVVRTPR